MFICDKSTFIANNFYFAVLDEDIIYSHRIINLNNKKYFSFGISNKLPLTVGGSIEGVSYGEGYFVKPYIPLNE